MGATKQSVNQKPGYWAGDWVNGRGGGGGRVYLTLSGVS